MNFHLCRCRSRCSSGETVKNDTLARNAFQSLSPEEQDKAYESLHGMEQPIVETSELIQSKLEELDRELEMLSENAKKYYTMAVNQEKRRLLTTDNAEKYVSSDKFKLMFLRADRFDAHQAARRLTTNFQEKFKLFGEEKLSYKITQVDMTSEADQNALKSGALWCTPEVTDRFGRLILLGRRQYCFQGNIRSVMRSAYYMIHSAMEDNESLQQKGVVVVAYNMNETAGVNPSQIRLKLPLMRMGFYAMPFWSSGVHMCYCDLREQIFSNFLLVVLPKHIRARFQGHFQKTHQECMFKLLPYGIDPETLPLTTDGHFKHDQWNDYLASRRAAEEELLSIQQTT